MKILYICRYERPVSPEFRDTRAYYRSQMLVHNNISIDYMGPLKRPLLIDVCYKAEKLYLNLIKRKTMLIDYKPRIAKALGKQIDTKLKHTSYDYIFTGLYTPYPYIQTKIKRIFWTDAIIPLLCLNYPYYQNFNDRNLKIACSLEKKVLEDPLTIAIYGSEWAAEAAMRAYNIDSSRIKVVPPPANLEAQMPWSVIRSAIDARPKNQCRLLFVGDDWQRKGGDFAVEVLREIERGGIEASLSVVGVSNVYKARHSNIRFFGYLKKSNRGHMQTLTDLYANSHFLILPTKADCTPNVICEASSFGLPSIASDVGGISSLIKNGINGQVFSLTATPDQYALYISELICKKHRYAEFARSTYDFFSTNLSTEVIRKRLRMILEECI